MVELAIAADDPKKAKKLVKRKPPEGFVTWTGDTFAKLQSAPPEPLHHLQLVAGIDPHA